MATLTQRQMGVVFIMEGVFKNYATIMQLPIVRTHGISIRLEV